jgi:translation initiation factor IF-3
LAKFIPNRNEQREPEFRVNDRIRVPDVRLVGDNLDALSELVGETIVNSEVYPTRTARQWAEKAELDLVEISPNSTPPVCRIIDYNKFLYDRKKKDKELKAKQVKTVIKEIRFGPNTDDHDFDFKLKHAIRFLEEGAKVKAYVQFKGRAIVFKDRGEELLKRFLEGLEEHGQPEADLKLEGRRMFVHIVSKKKKK